MPQITGDNGADTLTGTSGNDTIDGLNGPDRIDGGAGVDVLSGGGGGDTVTGGSGNDVLYGFGAVDVDPASGTITATLLADGFKNSLFAVSPPGDPDHFYVVEQHTGRIRVLDTTTGEVSATYFLNIADAALARGNEQGLLGLAFHPDYATNGKFYVNLTNVAGDTEVWEYTRSTSNPATADNASVRLILTFDQPFTNHNGGWMGFGPDGFLYIASGDGGSGGDPNGNGQNVDTLLGKMLRIDVDGDDFASDPNRNYAIPDDNPFVGIAGADEIWMLGLRNPWRASFDTATGDLWIGDVGQGAQEEIDFIAAGTGRGFNFGWNIREGDLPYAGGSTTGLIDPLLVTPRGSGPYQGNSITGGYVYHGTGGAQGLYVFGDFISGNIWTVQQVDGQAVDFINRNAQLVVDAGSLNLIASFAQDGRGNLYVVGLDGEIHRLTPSEAAADGADTLSGGDGNDRIYGGAGNDILNGDAGDDVIFGGIGADVMRGGAGDDTFYVDNAGDVVLEAKGEGDDVVYASVTYALTYTSYVQDLTLTGTGDIGATGNGLANVITGNSGNNVLDGGTKADRLIGGLGDDTYIVDNAGDVVIEIDGQGTDRVISSVSYALSNTSWVEGLTLTGTANLNATGNNIGNVILGNAGDNRIDGRRGGDVMTGGGGVDTFVWNALNESKLHTPDRVTDLQSSDIIDLSRIDADSNMAGTQHFVRVGAFTQTAGQLTMTYSAATGLTTLAVDVNGDGAADIRVLFDGNQTGFGNFVFS